MSVDPLAAAGFGLDTHAERYERARPTFTFDQELDTELLVDRVASSSYIAAMDPEPQQALLDDVRTLVAGFTQPFALPYVCAVHWCHRSSSSQS